MNKTKIIYFIICLLIIALFGCGCGNKQTMILDGNGTSESPYLITSKQDIMFIANNLNNNKMELSNAHYKLINDLDLEGEDWEPIGFYSGNFEHPGVEFNGTFNGNNCTIKNLKIKLDEKNEKDEKNEIKSFGQGIFASIGNEALIKNLNVENSKINCKTKDIDNITLGVITGVNNGGKILNCHVIATINVIALENTIGGIAGLNYGAIESCWSDSNIICNYELPSMGVANVGGLTGVNYMTINNSYSKGKILSSGLDRTRFVGGLAGRNEGNIYTCYSNSEVELNGGMGILGGLVGYNLGKIDDSYTNNSVISIGEIVSVGGLVGENGADEQVLGIISNSNSSSVISVNGNRMEDPVGAFAGANYGRILNCKCNLELSKKLNPIGEGDLGGVKKIEWEYGDGE